MITLNDAQFGEAIKLTEEAIKRKFEAYELLSLIRFLDSLYKVVKSAEDNIPAIYHGWVVLGTSRRCQDCGTVQYWCKDTETWEADLPTGEQTQ